MEYEVWRIATLHVDDWAKATRDPCPRVNCNIQVSVTKYLGPRLAIFACIFTCVEVAIEERKRERERGRERQLLCKLTSFAHLLSCLSFSLQALWLQATMSMSLILLFSLTQGHLACFSFEAGGEWIVCCWHSFFFFFYSDLQFS